ncbi:hypothetical protein CLF_101176 [Clonorchis sinensis]|uniref:Uncharacterized protein n=1 Tax=Clonorchis sinensis TaxID=79923 RepID=G7Y566_CLOSI|nr:hypothetical protein CLF_101176 [Clonorchis sinensis]
MKKYWSYSTILQSSSVTHALKEADQIKIWFATARINESLVSQSIKRIATCSRPEICPKTSNGSVVPDWHSSSKFFHRSIKCSSDIVTEGTTAASVKGGEDLRKSVTDFQVPPMRNIGCIARTVCEDIRGQRPIIGPQIGLPIFPFAKRLHLIVTRQFAYLKNQLRCTGGYPLEIQCLSYQFGFLEDIDHKWDEMTTTIRKTATSVRVSEQIKVGHWIREPSISLLDAIHPTHRAHSTIRPADGLENSYSKVERNLCAPPRLGFSKVLEDVFQRIGTNRWSLPCPRYLNRLFQSQEFGCCFGQKAYPTQDWPGIQDACRSGIKSRSDWSKIWTQQPIMTQYWPIAGCQWCIQDAIQNLGWRRCKKWRLADVSGVHAVSFFPDCLIERLEV